MAAPVNGQYFERVQLLVNYKVQVDSAGLFRVSVTGSEQAQRVNAFSPDHKISGVVRGNGQYGASISEYIKYSLAPFDWRSIDYDTQVISLAFLCPTANYGTSNVFGTGSNYLSVVGCFLEEQDPMNASGVGQPVTQDVRFIVTDWSWITRA